jgi:hypothetical protein
MQRKTTGALAARVKPVRPVLQTGHTGFAQKTPKNNKAKNQENELQTR